MKRSLGAQPPSKLGLSVSGGVDSMTLAALTSQWAKARNVELVAYIVDHHLRINSSEEAALVKSRLRSLNISSRILDAHFKDPGHAQVELLARNARRALLIENCRRDGISTILHGHTLDDQYELFVMRYLRQSSWFGLSGMSERGQFDMNPPPAQASIISAKPLLGFRKAQLEKWCTDHQIQWVEDYTNFDPTLTKRNAIRKLVAEFRTVLPQELTPEVIIPVTEHLSAARDYVLESAHTCIDSMLASEELVLHTDGSTRLKLTSRLVTLPDAVLTQVLFYIIRHVSPVSADKFSYKRSAVQKLTRSGLRGIRTIAGVKIACATDIAVFARAPPKASETLLVSQYHVTKEWSSWTLIDGRWWLRWRMPPTERREAAKMRISFARDVRNIITYLRLRGVLFGKSVTSVMPAHPIVTVVNDADQSSELIVGFPTLGCCTNFLDFQVAYKTFIY